MFTLDPRLQADSRAVCQLPLCQVRVMDDRRFPWLILIPQRPEVSEVDQLSIADQQALIGESSRAAECLRQLFPCDKINVAALGNVVTQLHWHVVARSLQDACWPGPVWGCGQRQPYPAAELEALIAQLKEGFHDGSLDR